LAAYFSTVVFSLGVKAKAGAPRAALDGVVGATIQAWPD
jgi:hypothetical protein